MRKLIILIAVTLINFSAFANIDKTTRTIKSELRTEIIKLLGTVDFNFNSDISTLIEFTINTKGEIIVLNVNSENTYVDNYVKTKLNYKVITSETNISGKTYKMPLTIKK